MANEFSQKRFPRGTCVPNLMLLSRSERLLQSSAWLLFQKYNSPVEMIFLPLPSSCVVMLYLLPVSSMKFISGNTISSSPYFKLVILNLQCYNIFFCLFVELAIYGSIYCTHFLFVYYHYLSFLKFIASE